MFIQVESTPNENALKFKPGITVVDPTRDGGSCFEFTQFSETISSPLARTLFSVPGVKGIIIRRYIHHISRRICEGVFFGADFITVNKQEDMQWAILKPEIYAAIMDYYASPSATSAEKPLVFPSSDNQTGATEEESEIVLMIRELLDTRIRPAVHEDGGDIEYVGFNTETGVVQLKLKGSCRGCSSSSVTLKSGIENMLRHYIPEVKSVEQVLDEVEQESNKVFAQLEEKLSSEK
jgi:Fe-S cluster biogenesis protein NfuA